MGKTSHGWWHVQQGWTILGASSPTSEVVLTPFASSQTQSKLAPTHLATVGHLVLASEVAASSPIGIAAGMCLAKQSDDADQIPNPITVSNLDGNRRWLWHHWDFMQPYGAGERDVNRIPIVIKAKRIITRPEFLYFVVATNTGINDAVGFGWSLRTLWLYDR